MAKKNRPSTHTNAARSKHRPGVSDSRQADKQGSSATMKDLLKADVLQKLQAQADELKAEEARKLEAERQRKEEARKAEQKRLDNDFEHLLKNSSLDWRKYK